MLIFLEYARNFRKWWWKCLRMKGGSKTATPISPSRPLPHATHLRTSLALRGFEGWEALKRQIRMKLPRNHEFKISFILLTTLEVDSSFHQNLNSTFEHFLWSHLQSSLPFISLTHYCWPSIWRQIRARKYKYNNGSKQIQIYKYNEMQQRTINVKVVIKFCKGGTIIS